MRETNNYSNVFLPKTVDNTHRLALNGLRFQPDSDDHSGEFLRSIDEHGEMSFANISPSHVIHVCPSFEDFGTYRSTIHTAMAHVNTLFPSSGNPYMIHMCAGLHFMTASVLIPDGVAVVGDFQLVTNLVLVAPITGSLFTFNGQNADIYNLTLTGNLLCDYLLEVSTGHVSGPQKITMLSPKIAMGHAKFGGSISFKNCRFINQAGNTTTQYGILAEFSGLASSTACTFFNAQQPATFIGIKFNSALAGSLFRSIVVQGAFIACHTAISISNSDVNIDSGDMTLNNYGVVIEGTSQVALKNANLNSNIYDIQVDAAAKLTTFALSLDKNKISVVDTDHASINYFEEDEDEVTGIHQLGNFVTGSKDFPSITFLGQGAYTWSGIAYFKYDTVGATFTDVTEDLRITAGLTTTIWDAVTDIFYMGDDEKFYSMEADIQTTFDGTYTAEYWNGSAWTVFDGLMTTSYAIPYFSCEDAIFALAEIQDTRFTVELSGTAFNWTKTTVDGSNKYWIRFTANTLVTSPILNNLKLLYSSTKIDLNGSILRYGNSRTFQPIVYDLNLIRSPGSASTTPADQDLYFGASSRLGREQNKLGVGDIIGLSFFAPNNVDSSSPFRASIAFCSDSTAALQADFQVQITIGNVHDGDLIYFTQASANGNPIRDEHQVNVNLTPNQTNGRYCVIQDLDLPIPFIRSRNINGVIDELFSSDITRISDSNGNDLVFIQISLSFLQFCDGLAFVSL